MHYALTDSDMLYRDELEQLAAEQPGVRLVKVFTDQPGRGDLDGFLTAVQLDAADPQWRAAEVGVRGAGPTR